MSTPLGRAPRRDAFRRFVGRPGQRHGGQWAMYAFDTTEKALIGRRSREWTAVGNTEIECVREMARCLREISEGRTPK